MLVLRRLKYLPWATGDTLVKVIRTVDLQLIVVHRKLRLLERSPSMELWLFTYLGMHIYDWKICSKAAGSSLYGILV